MPRSLNAVFLGRCPAVLGLLAGSSMSHVVFAQSTDPFPAVFELSSLLPANGGDGSNGFVLNGIDPSDYSGIAVSSAGDFNGDGIDDLLIGANYADPNGVAYAGECYVIYGRSGLGAIAEIPLSAGNGSNGFVIQGVGSNDQAGRAVASAGDVNGDGFDDLLIGAPTSNAATGATYIVFGGPAVGTSGTLSLATLTGPDGFVINGIEQVDFSGRAISSAGDVNGDGFDDVVIGAYTASPDNIGYAGQCYVVFGAADLGTTGTGSGGSFDLASLSGPDGFAINGVAVGDSTGISVASAGDLDDDGYDDIVLGASDAEANGNGFAGRSYIVFGAANLGNGGTGSGGVFDLAALNGPNGIALMGANLNDHSGRSVAGCGDVNADGIADLLIGAYSASPNSNAFAGESYVVFGAADLGTSGHGNGGTIDLVVLNGTTGFAITGIDPQDFSGQSVSPAGDLNNDGIADLIIGATGADPNGVSRAGETYVVFGAPGLGSSGKIDLASLSGTNGFVINGENASDGSGLPVAYAGDLNNDGVDDIAIGADGADPNGITGAGRTYIVFGRDVNTCQADTNGDGILDNGDIGTFVQQFLAGDLAADFNGDGILDNGDIGSFVAAFLAGC